MMTGHRGDPKRGAGRKKRPATTVLDGADPVERLLMSLAGDPDLAAVVSAYRGQARKAGRAFGKNGLKTNEGKLFALFTQGTLVVKLPENRVAALVAEGAGKPFNPGHGRLMKEWLTVTSAEASWDALAKEAFGFVTGRSRTRIAGNRETNS